MKILKNTFSIIICLALLSFSILGNPYVICDNNENFKIELNHASSCCNHEYNSHSKCANLTNQNIAHNSEHKCKTCNPCTDTELEFSLISTNTKTKEILKKELQSICFSSLVINTTLKNHCNYCQKHPPNSYIWKAQHLKSTILRV